MSFNLYYRLYYLKVFFCRKDVRIFIFCTATGAILQVLSRRYLKNHPEFLEDLPESKEIPPRGGAAPLVGNALAQAILVFLAEHGLTAGLLSGAGVIISQISISAVSTYLRESLPQNLQDKSLVELGEETFYQYDESLDYLVKVLNDPTIPFDEKQELARNIFTKYLDLKTHSGRRNFVICIVFILYTFSIKNHSSFYIMMKSLIKAIREGKISKAIGRVILRKLQKKGIVVDPELVEIVRS